MATVARLKLGPQDHGRELYFQVPTIKEYWVIDARESPDKPKLIMHRRHGRRWRIFHLSYGETYTTKLLPGFELLIDPRR